MPRKGASRILDLLRNAIKENNLEDKVSLAGTLCLCHCAEPGANMKIGDEVITGITEDNFADFFETRVKKVVC